MMRDLATLAANWPLLLLALVVPIALLTAFFLAVHAGTRTRKEWMGAFLAGVPLTLVAGVVLTARNLDENALAIVNLSLVDVASGNWVTRVATLACLFIALERGARFVFAREFRQARGFAVFLGLLAYLIAANVLSALFGSSGGFNHQLLYAPVVALGIFAYAQNNMSSAMVVLRNALLVFLLASLLVLPIRPSMVAETGYGAGLLPGFNIRFYGFATHPNTLAPLCLMLMCCLRLEPFGNRLPNLLAGAVVFVSIVLTQSKTSLLLVCMASSYFWWIDNRSALALHDRNRQSQKLMALVAGVFVLSGLLVLALLMANMFSDGFAVKLTRIADRLQLGTLTGRTVVWDATFTVVEDNWIFGYGPDLWGPEFRLKTGLLFTHAHNQYIQTLGAAGVVGLIALIAYLCVLGRAAWQTRQVSRGVSWAVFVFLVVRGFTEVPLSVGNAMQSEYVVQMFLMIVCVGCLPAVHGQITRPIVSPERRGYFAEQSLAKL